MCPLGWMDLKCIVVSVVAGFRYMSVSMCVSSDDCEVENDDVAVGF